LKSNVGDIDANGEIDIDEENFNKSEIIDCEIEFKKLNKKLISIFFQNPILANINSFKIIVSGTIENPKIEYKTLDNSLFKNSLKDWSLIPK
ncbi:MAG: hypothetical protein U9N34_02755, partial [Candidatus Cloacimonadota bacterium]|nr:hypothetical protein [Candidatus Cloacimonadota bacterium]